MQIAPDRAFWILDFYRRHATRLYLSATISGECAAAALIIMDVSQTLQRMNIRLLDDEGSQSWDREIKLGHARYFFSQLGDPSFTDKATANCHSVLLMQFPDGSSLCFTERVALEHLPASGKLEPLRVNQSWCHRSIS
jgi:hypothetical protein